MIKLIGFAAIPTIASASIFHFLIPSIHFCNFSCWLIVGGLGFAFFYIILFGLFYLLKKSSKLPAILALLFTDRELDSISGKGDNLSELADLTERPIPKLLCTFTGFVILIFGITFGVKPVNCIKYCTLDTEIYFVSEGTKPNLGPIKLEATSGNVLKISPNKFNKDTLQNDTIWIRTKIWIPTNDESLTINVNGQPAQLTPNWNTHKMEEQEILVNRPTLHQFLKDGKWLSER